MQLAACSIAALIAFLCPSPSTSPQSRVRHGNVFIATPLVLYSSCYSACCLANLCKSSSINFYDPHTLPNPSLLLDCRFYAIFLRGKRPRAVLYLSMSLFATRHFHVLRRAGGIARAVNASAGVLPRSLGELAVTHFRRTRRYHP